MSKTSGIVLDIQRSAMHDGPGIRTTVFLKGCVLRCAWCHNPESFRLEPQTVQTARGPKTYGHSMSIDAVMRQVLRDSAYYRASGGGMTISGGEPTVQFDFCCGLLQAARLHGVHTCLDTSGHVEPERISALLPLVDLFLFDYKATGSNLHRQLTGQPSELILQNLHRLCAQRAQVLLRCPMVPGLNATADHFAAIGELSRRYAGQLQVEILPFHRSGSGKYVELGLRDPCRDVPPPDESTLQTWRDLIQEHGVQNARLIAG